MIDRLETIDEIKPIFIEYLNYMSQFFDIKHYDSWREGALKHLERYSNKDDCHVYVLRKSGTIIGFALVNKHFRFNSDGFAIAEFFIRKQHKRKGYGRKLAEHVFSQFPGSWEVAVSKKNSAARKFWKQVLSSYRGGQFQEKKIGSFRGYGFVFNNT